MLLMARFCCCARRYPHDAGVQVLSGAGTQALFEPFVIRQFHFTSPKYSDNSNVEGTKEPEC